ncbi:D-glucuronyl C5-epimerase-like [Argopecten irradians]|uniref:D-glucuronyl C5-epimerase-like n=1 Tax=Argopecten irradians TaxID=31199 RepID=UPI00371D682C
MAPRVSLKLVVLMMMGVPFLITMYHWGQCDLSRLDDQDFRDGYYRGPVDKFDSSARIPHRDVNAIGQPAEEGPLPYKEIECVVNGDYSIKGRLEDKEVYLPFTFVQRYFEVYGSINSYDGYDRFELQHSYSQIHPPQDSYSPDGVFMSFEFYNVEDRRRVKCISGIEGVPVSVQWNHDGHFYPIQIAQYGLSHYSKHLMEPSPQHVILEDGEGGDLNTWLLPDRRSQIAIKTDRTNEDNNLIEFDTPDLLKNPGITISVEDHNLSTLSIDVKFINNGSVTVLLRTNEGNLFRIHYVLSNTTMTLEDRDLYYGIGTSKQGKWTHLTRKVLIDYDKGQMLKIAKSKRGKVKLTPAKIVAVCFRGHGFVDNITLSSEAHLDHFFDAANYLVNYQDSRGGWPIQVTRKIIPGKLELKPGWYSAMGQGQAISLLVRAYSLTKDNKYLQSAAKALAIFEIPSSEGGVLQKFANTYDWYEEYPTTPGTFVLNGFIYSLIGLYDLKVVSSGQTAEHAAKLYNNGIQTLKNMLLMYDSGTGTFYDLKHISLGVAPNRARWDYHTVHINQLLLLSLINDEPLFQTTAQRWMGYLKGKLSPHN